MRKSLLLSISLLWVLSGIQAQNFSYSDSWGKAGFNLVNSKSGSVEVVYSIPQFGLEEFSVNGQSLKNLNLPGAFLLNDEGMPNLPGQGRYIAMPQGAVAKLKIISQRTEVLHNVDICPAHNIPAENDDRPLKYVKNPSVYSKNALYPSQPVKISGHEQIRGVDVVMLGITPFQYNPITKDLIVYRDIKIQIDFEGGNGHFGDDAFRNRFWDPILDDALLNHASLPVIDYNNRLQSYSKKAVTDECEYIIISPDGSDFVRWADSIANFRNQQGILTHVFTLTDVGGNTTTAIETFIDDAYNNWTIKPAACLLLGDYGSDQQSNVISPLKTLAGETFPSDHIYADVNADDMAEIVFSRIVANNNAQLTTMCSKILNYERNPPMDTSYYQHPITALGWQTERWFQLCSEVVGGYFRTKMGKHPVRINAIYQGTPGSIWSSASNTNSVVSYFGPAGTGYIPQTPAEMPCCWNGGNAAQVNAAIEDGSFMLQHRDHGMETGWGEPSYNNNSVDALQNVKPTFVMSINCLTGKYNLSYDCFAERFLKHLYNGQNSGALGLVCPSEVSYSFVNDTFVWGMYDNMWPDFMPTYGTQPASRGVDPAFGMVAGKYFLKQSNWPYNTGDKKITYYLFHMHGDAFFRLFAELPQNLTVTHDAEIPEGATTFNITANDSADIALTVNNVIIATGLGSASGPVVITIPAQSAGTMVLVTVTKQNYLRYQDFVPVTNGQLIANFSASATNLCPGTSVNFTDVSTGGATAWAWTFDGGTPSTSADKNPVGIVYSAPGDYSVKLRVTRSTTSDSITKTEYIHVYPTPTADFTTLNASCMNDATIFSDLSASNGGTITDWMWDFGDGTSGASTQNPLHTFTYAGTFNVTLTVKNNGTCDNAVTKQVVVGRSPNPAAQPSGPAEVCPGSTGNTFTTLGAQYANSYLWEVSPAEAGTVTGTTTTATFDASATYTGTASITVSGVNDCGSGTVSSAFNVTIKVPAAAPEKPTGADTVNIEFVPVSDFITTGVPSITDYTWFITPANAGTITGTGMTGTVTWSTQFRGPLATITVKGVDNCGPGLTSDHKDVVVKNTLGIAENNQFGFEIYPNPTSGKFSVEFRGPDAIVNIRIVNELGSSVYTMNDVKVAGKLIRNIDLSSLSAGIYYLKVETGSGTIVRKLVIRK
ncbi:MAG: C25 family cysteine peptidase [Bacteroidetes bacterium]|nr:C25 family cysteine peptidase [Bacteroidota bacterium]